MKTRAGFVSNSSTSSFIIVGVRVPWGVVEKLRESVGIVEPDDDSDGWDDYIDNWRRWFKDALGADLQGYPESSQVVGVMVAEGGDRVSLDDPVAKIADAVSKAEEIKTRLGLEGPVQLVAGEYSSEDY